MIEIYQSGCLWLAFQLADGTAEEKVSKARKLIASKGTMTLEELKEYSEKLQRAVDIKTSPYILATTKRTMLKELGFE